MKQNMVKRIMSGVLAAAMVFSSLTVSTATTAKAATQVNLQEGTEYIIVSKKSNKAITVKDNSKNDNAKIVQMSVTESASQIWTLDSDGKGYYQLVNKNSGKALDVPNSSKEEGKAMIQWSKGNGDNQKWKISHEGNGYYRITPKLSSKFGLNVSGNSTKDGAEIIQWNYGNGSDNSKWEIREVKKQSSNSNGVLRLEAEDGATNGIMNVAGASGGKMVGDIEDWNNPRDPQISFSYKIECDKTGDYTVRVYYASAENRSLAWYNIPNGYKYDYSTFNCPSTGDWTTVGKPVETKVTLQKGTNELGFGGSSGWGPNVDYIEILGLNETSSDSIRFEAEDCGYKNGAKVMNASNASGGKMLGDLGDWPNGGGAFGFTVKCNTTGNYEVRVGYATAEDRTLAIINEPNGYKTHIHEVPCKSTGGWTTTGEAKGQIYLAEGTNYITVSSVSAWAPNVDYIEILGLNNSGESVLRLEAEDGTSASIMNVPEASGGKMVGDIEDWDNPYSPDMSFGYQIKCNKTGRYKVRIYYASDENRGLVWYNVPNGYKFNYGTVACPSTGGWTKVGEPAEAEIYLEEGTNSLGFGGNNGWGPNVDYIEIIGL